MNKLAMCRNNPSQGITGLAIGGGPTGMQAYGGEHSVLKLYCEQTVWMHWGHWVVGMQ